MELVRHDVCNVQVISLFIEDFVSPRFPLVTQVGREYITFQGCHLTSPHFKEITCSSNILLNIFYVWKDNIPERPVLRLALNFFPEKKPFLTPASRTALQELRWWWPVPMLYCVDQFESCLIGQLECWCTCCIGSQS